MAKLRKIAAACILYAQDHESCLPRSLEDLYPGYISSLEDFACPAAIRRQISTEANPAPGARAVYTLIPGPESGLAANRILVCDSTAGNHHGLGRNAAFADGHVTWLHGSDEDFAALLPDRREHAHAHAHGRGHGRRRHGRSNAT